MNSIIVEKPTNEKLEELGVSGWPIWEKEISKFSWTYDSQETCYILEGRATVEPEDGEGVEFSAGDFVTFPEGLRCIWNITSPIKKHYKFGG